MDEKAFVISRVCHAISADRASDAVDVLARSYPFTAVAQTPRKYGPAQAIAVFRRDGFIDRYSGTKLVFPPVLRIVSSVLPGEFPFHTNWKTNECHPAYWEVGATVDHLIPVTRGGADSPENWVTTSMARNSAKMNWTIQELGWSLHEPGRLEDWDGLLGWFMGFVERRPALRRIKGIDAWCRAAGLGSKARPNTQMEPRRH